jgi:hypothetical protein
MNLKRGIAAALLGAAVLASGIAAHAAGMWGTWAIIGGSSYCASTVTGTGGLGGITGTGQGTVGSICAQTVPAGPPTFAGSETFPVDIGPIWGGASMNGGAVSAVITLPQIGQGPMVDLTTVATAQTIPNLTPWYFLDGAQASALTVTMPSQPVEGQIQRVVCEAATVGALTIAANTGQTIKYNPNTACVAGVGYSYRFQASNLTWYKF